MTKTLTFRIARALALLFLSAFALLAGREYLIAMLGLALFQLIIVPVLLLAIWLGIGDWLAELRENKKRQQASIKQ